MSLENFYSCQFCGRIFENEETIILPEKSPVCSSKCKFNIIYHLLKENYTDENLEFMDKTLKNSPSNYQFNKNIALFELSKHFSKFILSNVICVFSFLILKKTFSREDSTFSLSHIPPFYVIKGDEKVNEKVNEKLFEKGGLSNE